MPNYWTTIPVVMHGLAMQAMEVQVESDAFNRRSHLATVSIDFPGFDIELTEGYALSFLNLTSVGGSLKGR